MSAVQSMAGFREGFESISQLSEDRPDLWFLLYDALHDDDEEIREATALTVSWLVSFDDIPVTHQQVKKILSSGLRLDTASCFSGAVGRMLRQQPDVSLEGDDPLGYLKTKPFSYLLATARQTDTDLFAEEKQNLYLDDSKETLFWYNILRSNGWNFRGRVAGTSVELPSGHDPVQTLYSWTVDAIDKLRDTAQAEKLDGPLGWISAPDVFALGLAAIMAASLLLEVGEREQLKVHDLREAVERLWTVGKRTKVHGSWLSHLAHAVELKES